MKNRIKKALNDRQRNVFTKIFKPKIKLRNSQWDAWEIFEKISAVLWISSARADEFDEELQAELEWEPQPEIDAYVIQVSQDRQFKAILVDEHSDDSKFVVMTVNKA